MRKNLFTLLVFFAAVTCGGVAAMGQDGTATTYVPEGEIVQTDTPSKGWAGAVVVGASFNIAQNSNVVGQTEGYSLLLSGNATGSLDYIHLDHEWRNILRLTQGWARTPVIDEFIKSNDVLALESLYNYFVTSWFGPFARLSFETAMLAAEDVRANDTTYVVTRSNGQVDTYEGVRRITLANAFEPFSMEQSIGVFAQPIKSNPFTLAVRAGVGGRETLADGVLVVSDDGATPELEVLELSNVLQAGAELFLTMNGKAVEDRLRWSALASVMFPFLTNDDTDRGVMDLTKWAFAANLSISVFSWMSLDYQLKVLLDPQLLDEWQIQNNLLLTFNYTLIEAKAPPAPPAPDPVAAEKEALAAELKAAQEKAQEAENKIQEAQAQALAAEERAKAAEARAAAAEAAAPAPAPVEEGND